MLGIATSFFCCSSPFLLWGPLLLTPFTGNPSSIGLANQGLEALAATPFSATELFAGTWGEGVLSATQAIHGATGQPAKLS